MHAVLATSVSPGRPTDLLYLLVHAVVYSAGATIQVTQKMNTWHGGYMMIKLCPTARSGATQGCFDQYPLVR